MLIKYGEKKISQPICIRHFWHSISWAPQYELDSFVTIATY